MDTTVTEAKSVIAGKRLIGHTLFQTGCVGHSPLLNHAIINIVYSLMLSSLLFVYAKQFSFWLVIIWSMLHI